MRIVIMEDLAASEEDYDYASKLLNLSNNEWNAFIMVMTRANDQEELREDLRDKIKADHVTKIRALDTKKRKMSAKAYSIESNHLQIDLDHKLERVGGPKIFKITNEDLVQAKRFLYARIGRTPEVHKLRRRLVLYVNLPWEYPLKVYTPGAENDGDCYITLSDDDKECKAVSRIIVEPREEFTNSGGGCLEKLNFAKKL
jgi:hypothetical protein